MRIPQGGTYIIENFFIEAVPNGVMPIISMSGSNRKQYLKISNVQVALDIDLTDPADLFDFDTRSSIDAKQIVRTVQNISGWVFNDTQTYYQYEVINGIEQ